MTEKTNPKCPYCNSKNTKKEGKRKNKYEIIQKYQCKDCKKYFTDKKLQNKTYPINIILKIISYYNLGYTQTHTLKLISKQHKINVPQKTISNWINEYKPLLPFHKLRNKAIKLYSPDQIIEKHTFLHSNLPYTFQIHKAKLELLFKDIKYNNQFINLSKFYQPIKSYLEKITTNKFPHHIFKEKISLESPDAEVEKEINSLKNKNAITASEQKKTAKTSGSDADIAQTDKLVNKTKNAITALEKQTNVHSPYADVAELKNIKSKKLIEQRASQLKFPHLKITHLQKINLANKLAKLAINLAKSNKDRHNAIQNFFLINDSTTIAVEVPVYLTNDDIKYFKKKGFTLDFNQNKNAITASEQKKKAKISSSDADIAKSRDTKLKNKLIKTYRTPITGHIDILQVRNNLIHILDYKPEADKTNPINQLTLYALALASRTKLDLHSFKCAWFDEKTYFEFFPLHAVYHKK